MKLAMIGLGRMGANIARRLMKHGHQVVGYDRSPEAMAELAKDGAGTADSLEALCGMLESPAIYWVMLPAGGPTDETIETLSARAIS